VYDHDAFDTLQQRLDELLRDTVPEAATDALVVCPSLTFPVTELRKITGIEFYEQRLLCCALLLRDPGLEVLYPTSVAIDDEIVDYYLSWLPDPGSARQRLHLFTVDDARPSPLTGKLLQRPDVVAAMRDQLRGRRRAYMLAFTVTEAEAELAVALGVPLYGARPELAHLGSKSGARRLAIQAGVDVFEGAGDLRGIRDIEAAIQRIRAARPECEAVVAKLDNGFSGQGNVIVEMSALRSPLTASDAVFCAPTESWDSYARKVEAEGAVVEELARHEALTSPSVQLRILPGQRVEVISTHDQILGGPDDQVYIGCRFPARPDYAERIQEAALRVAAVMAQRGVLGSFGIDFVVVPGRGIFLSEINLRLGGTTHPFLMARYVTGGTYDPASGQLLVDGEPRVYKASDNIKAERYVGLAPADVIAAVAAAELAYDPVSKTGVTLHLLGALPAHGKFGVVCIARTHEEADGLYEAVLARVDALSDGPARELAADQRP
jgi:hypothetical protein